MIQDITPYRYHIEYRDAAPEPEDMALAYKAGTVLQKQGEQLQFPTVSDILQSDPNASFQYLFSIDAIRFFLVEREVPAFGRWQYDTLTVFRQKGPAHLAFAGITGSQLWRWYRSNAYCGKCGKPMEKDKAERAMRCPACGNLVYPRINPAVIVAVTDGDRIVLTKYQPSRGNAARYALIAGFMETGETPEDTVRREVMEEVGLRVRDIRYYKAQPWSFSDTLLLGFQCTLDGPDKITRQEDELSEAKWVARSQVPPRENLLSLTAEMMERFRKGEL